MLQFFRYTFGYCWVFVMLFLFFFVLLFRPFDRGNNRLISKYICPVLYWIMGIKIVFEDSELLIEGSPRIYVTNHQHTLDLFLFSQLPPPGTLALGKRSLLYIPFLGWTYWLGGNFLINRTDHQSAMETMLLLEKWIVEKKSSFVIMPEGTRSKGTGIAPFKKGAFRLAIKAQVPIQPIAVSSVYGLVDFNRWKAGTIIVKSLPEISTIGMDIKDTRSLMENVRNIIVETNAKLDQRLKNS